MTHAPDDPRVAYFIGASRATGAITISRLILALYNPAHLYVIHVDRKAEESLMQQLKDLTANHANIHLVRGRRRVQWGGWSVVAPLLDAIASLEAVDIDYDFLINLSESDLALRTSAEIVRALAAARTRAPRRAAPSHPALG